MRRRGPDPCPSPGPSSIVPVPALPCSDRPVPEGRRGGIVPTHVPLPVPLPAYLSLPCSCPESPEGAKLTRCVLFGKRSLAPQDYHRYHSPCNGVFSVLRQLGNALYTVNPMAVREEIDVYTENKRIIATVDSPQFGKVVLVIIGTPERQRA